jgi:hypothetical protein
MYRCCTATVWQAVTTNAEGTRYTDLGQYATREAALAAVADSGRPGLAQPVPHGFAWPDRAPTIALAFWERYARQATATLGQCWRCGAALAVDDDGECADCRRHPGGRPVVHI